MRHARPHRVRRTHGVETARIVRRRPTIDDDTHRAAAIVHETHRRDVERDERSDGERDKKAHHGLADRFLLSTAS